MVQRTRLSKFALLIIWLISSSLSLAHAQETKDVLGALRYRHIGPVDFRSWYSRRSKRLLRWRRIWRGLEDNRWWSALAANL